jgi:electron-transferring-flavoprotein dehydrogenase
LHRFGLILGGAFNFIEQNLFRGRLPLTLHDRRPDHACMGPAEQNPSITYPKPDGVISFDRLTSVYVSNAGHEEDQPCHLVLRRPELAIDVNLAIYEAPEQRYCPAGVYEIVEDKQHQSRPRLQINAANCLHCKTCDIKDPSQNIVWIPPEGGGGPNYPNM